MFCGKSARPFLSGPLFWAVVGTNRCRYDLDLRSGSGWIVRTAATRRGVRSLREEAAKFCRDSVGVTAVVGRGVPHAAEYDFSGVWQYVAEPFERGRQVADAPGATEEKDFARQLREALEWAGGVAHGLCVVSHGRDQLLRR